MLRRRTAAAITPHGAAVRNIQQATWKKVASHPMTSNRTSLQLTTIHTTSNSFSIEARRGYRQQQNNNKSSSSKANISEAAVSNEASVEGNAATTTSSAATVAAAAAVTSATETTKRDGLMGRDTHQSWAAKEKEIHATEIAHPSGRQTTPRFFKDMWGKHIFQQHGIVKTIGDFFYSPIKSRKAQDHQSHVDSYTDYMTQEELDEYHVNELEPKYGVGSIRLFRNLYRELCEEMRHEKRFRPPAPIEGWVTKHEPGRDYFEVETEHTDAANPYKVYTFMDLSYKEPKNKNPWLTAIVHRSFESVVVRGDYIISFHNCYCEGHMGLENMKIYRNEKLPLHQFSHDIDYVRKLQRYDGPYIHHLEFVHSNELCDIMHDYGVTRDLARFCGHWACYLEHQEYVRWNLGMMETLIDREDWPDETLLLTREERANLDYEPEDYLALVGGGGN